MNRFLPFAFSLACLLAQTTPEALMESGHFKRARAILEPRLHANPNDAEALCMMSRLKQLGNDRDTALKLAERAVQLDGSNPRYHIRLASVLADMSDRAGALRQIVLGRRFKREMELTLSLDSRNVEALTLQMLMYLNAPAIFGGDKNKARQTADRIAQIDPVQGCFAQVLIARAEKQDGQIEGLYRKAVVTHPASYEAHVRLGQYFTSDEVKKYDQAESHAREALRIDPDRVDAHNVLAYSLVLQDKWAELDDALARAENAIPDNWVPYFVAAEVCLSKTTELPRAERYLRKYLSQEPELRMPTPAHAHWLLGQALEKQARKPEAIAEFQTAVKLDPDSPAKKDLKRLQ